MLNKCELRYSSIEKEALAIIEAVWKWAHFLIGCHFTVRGILCSLVPLRDLVLILIMMVR